MRSVKLRLRDAVEAIEREKLTADEVIACSVFPLSYPAIQVTSDAIIRLYHQLKIARSALKAETENGYLHVQFVSRGVCFAACVQLEKAAQFIDSKQEALPAPRAKRVAGGGGQRRLSFAGGDS
jgi:hypothetical protein